MIRKDYIIVNKNDLSIFESFCILIQNSNELFKNEEWFILFLNNKLQKDLYIKFIKINFKINQLQKTQIIDQFDKDISRTKFQLNKNHHEFIIDNRINHEITYNVIKKLIKKHYKNQVRLFYRILFLCSQTSLAFLINKIHFSILSKSNDLIVAELPNTMKHKQKRKMNITVMLENNEVIIEKHLRILKNDIEKHEMIPIQNFKILIYFKINDNLDINAIVNIKKT